MDSIQQPRSIATLQSYCSASLINRKPKLHPFCKGGFRGICRAKIISWLDRFRNLGPVEEQVPHKQFYTIGEVSRITGVRPHVLRYWESRGKILRPTRRKSRHRLYRPADIQLIFELKRLREEEKMTLPAMQRQLKDQVGQYHRTRNLPQPPPSRLFPGQPPGPGPPPGNPPGTVSPQRIPGITALERTS